MRHLGTRDEVKQQIELYTSTCRNQLATINTMISPEYIGCMPEMDWLELRYPAASWMCNLRGVLHGGIIGAIADNAMGGIAWCLSKGKSCPTISLQLSFVRPIQPGNPICVRSRLIGGGRTLYYTAAEVWEEGNPHRILASATAVYAAG